jgi:hypothetical protein
MALAPLVSPAAAQPYRSKGIPPKTASAFVL